MNANTGKLSWRFYKVPGDPSKPFEHPDLAAAAKTWTNDWWKQGGGAGVWNGMAYDDANDLVLQPGSGLFPGTAGGSYSYRADPNYVPAPTTVSRPAHLLVLALEAFR